MLYPSAVMSIGSSRFKVLLPIPSSFIDLPHLVQRVGEPVELVECRRSRGTTEEPLKLALYEN